MSRWVSWRITQDVMWLSRTAYGSCELLRTVTWKCARGQFPSNSDQKCKVTLHESIFVYQCCPLPSRLWGLKTLEVETFHSSCSVCWSRLRFHFLCYFFAECNYTSSFNKPSETVHFFFFFFLGSGMHCGLWLDSIT